MSRIFLAFAASMLVLSASADAAPDRATLPKPSGTVSPSAFPALTAIYFVSGVRTTSGADNTGTATTFHCSNWSGASQQIRIVIINYNGTVSANVLVTILNARTWTGSTHGTVAYNEDAYLAPGKLIEQGTAQILATNAKIFCSVQVNDATTQAPNGVDLHLIRANGVAGTTE